MGQPMYVRFACPACGNLLKAAQEVAGKTRKCPGCGRSIKVPAVQSLIAKEPGAPVTPPQLPPQVISEAAPDRPPVPSPSVAIQVPQSRQASHSFGAASLVLGTLAVFICWVPFLGLLGLPLSALGLLLGAVGLWIAFVRKGSGAGFAIAGTAISLLAAVVVIAVTYAILATPVKMALAVASKQKARAKQDWTDARNAVQQGDLQVRVRKVSVGKVQLRGMFGRPIESEDERLIIELELTNKAPTRKAEYHTWSDQGLVLDRDDVTLKDNFGNRYTRIGSGLGYYPMGAVEGYESIYPHKSITDVLMFEPPLDTIGYLRLELPANNFGGTGMLRFQIPKEMIVR